MKSYYVIVWPASELKILHKALNAIGAISERHDGYLNIHVLNLNQQVLLSSIKGKILSPKQNALLESRSKLVAKQFAH